MGKSRVESVEKTSQATPFAEDVLQNLRRVVQGEIESLSPLSREAGTAIRQFVGGRDLTQDRFRDLAAPIVELSERQTDRGAADLRESFGIAGSRFGTQAAQGEGLFRGEAQAGLDATLAGLFNQMFEREQERKLRGISEMFRQGQGNLAPIIELARLGILPSDTVVHPSTFQQVAAPIAGLVEGGSRIFDALDGRRGSAPTSLPQPRGGFDPARGPGDFPTGSSSFG